MHTLLRFASFALLATLSANAQTLINVKVRTGGSVDATFQATSAAVLGTSSDFWNGFNYSSSTPFNVSLLDSTGNGVEGVTMTIQNSGGVGSGTAAGSVQLTTGINLGLYAYQNAGGIFTVTLNGLAASQTYRFIGYSAEPATNPDSGGIWAVTTGSLISGATTNTGASAALSAGAGVAYVDLLVQSTASGSLVLTDTNLTGAPRTILQGFQLQTASAIPEPSTSAVLAGLGVLTLTVGLRRKRA